MNIEITIGNRRYLVEKIPIGNVLITNPILVIHGKDVLYLDYSWEDGWIGTPDNKQYTTAKVSQLNGTNFYYTSTYELHRVIKTTSKKLNERFKLAPLP